MCTSKASAYNALSRRIVMIRPLAVHDDIRAFEGMTYIEFKI